MVAREFKRQGEKHTQDLFQGKTYEDLTKWYDFHARQYDASLGRWFGVDPQDQFSSPYLAMGNNPVMGIDPDGEWVHIAIGAAIGGTVNLISNWKNIDNVWEGVAAFGIGAGAGAATAACGACGGALWIAAAGSAATGAVNNIISQTGNGVGLGDVNLGQVGKSAAIGGISGMAGFGAGKWATNNLANPLVNGLNIKGKALSGLINGSIGGAAGGAAGGFVGGLLFSGGDLGAGFKGGFDGLVLGGAIGGATGVGIGYHQARRSGSNPWTGKALSSNAKGDFGVQQAIKDIQEMGGKVLGERPAGYKLSGGRGGFTDLIVELKGEIVIVEVKYGDRAALNPNQKINYPKINQGDLPTFSGKNGQVIPPGTTNIRVIVIHYTTKGRLIYSPYK